MTEKKQHDIYKVIGSLIIIGAFLVTLMISMLSEFGAHPDEYDVKACLDWAMSHWIWPDMRLQGTGLGDTYSLYGYTKMCNYTVYFLVMSKIAFFFKLFMGTWPYYRVPNLLLALLMLVIMLSSIQKKKYLMLAFGVCAQAWYIFSYVTADALDFVFAFLAVYLLADESSVLWRTLKDNASDCGNATAKNSLGRSLPACLLLGLLYGMMLLGKPYYYSIHVLTFAVLLLFLIDTPKEKRKSLWRKYLIILGTCCLIYAARYSLDLYYYGFDKDAAQEQMMEQYANYDKKPSTPLEDQVQTYHAYEKGYPLSFIFEDDPHWFEESYRSYVSARISSQGDDWYYVIMGLLYAGIYGFIGYELCIAGRKDVEAVEENKDSAVGDRMPENSNKIRIKNDRIIFAVGTLLILGGITASVMNSYLIDSQPQGRYLLPIGLVICYMSSRSPKLWKNKIFCGIVLTAGCLSVVYYGLFDSRALIDLAYVRSLF